MQVRGKSKIQVEKNKKVCEDSHEEILFDEDGDFEIDEAITVRSTGGDILLNKQDNFEINRLFNQLPIRILNSHQFPFFYAEDVAKVLGIKKVRTSLTNFTEKEIVSQELRQKYNIITYKLHRGKLAIDNRKILLTEFGVYRLIMNSRSQLADTFRDFVYDVLYQLRTTGEFKIKAELEQLRTTNETILAENGTLKSEIDHLKVKQDQLKNLCDEIILVEHKNNPYEILPTNIPARMLKKSVKTKINPVKNRIDDPVPHAYRLAQELGIEHPFGSDAEIADVPTHELFKQHQENVVRAREFIELHSPANSYLVTTELTPELINSTTVLHRVYVRNGTAAMKTLQSSLAATKPTRASSRAHWYSCDRAAIIKNMNAVALD
jgi:prophage antirepressor-like protein